jgi:hypothetical protein
MTDAERIAEIRKLHPLGGTQPGWSNDTVAFLLARIDELIEAEATLSGMLEAADEEAKVLRARLAAAEAVVEGVRLWNDSPIECRCQCDGGKTRHACYDHDYGGGSVIDRLAAYDALVSGATG